MKGKREVRKNLWSKMVQEKREEEVVGVYLGNLPTYRLGSLLSRNSHVRE